MVDAADSKSAGPCGPCRFDSGLRHHGFPGRLLRILAAVLTCLVGPGAVPNLGAEEAASWTWRAGGLLFGDFYHVAAHHTARGDGATGAVLRRGYLTFDVGRGDRWSGRLRLEVNQAGAFETYELDVDVKDLHVAWKPGRHRIVFGLSPTPTFDLIEEIWGLRYLVRTPLDLQGVASRDTGVSAQGPLGAGGTLRYRIMGGAGLEFGNESGDGRKWMGALTWSPRDTWMLDLYADHETLAGPTDRTTLQIFAGRRSDAWRWGLQYSHQDRQDDPTLEVLSAFLVRRVGGRASVMGRVDRLPEPSPKGNGISYLPFDPTAPATLFVGGVELRLGDHAALTPNAVVIAYDRNAQGVVPRTDVHLRLTLFVDFER